MSSQYLSFLECDNGKTVIGAKATDFCCKRRASDAKEYVMYVCSHPTYISVFYRFR